LSEPLRFTGADEWRRWLEANKGAREVWLTIRKKRSRRPGISYEEAVEEALAHGWIDSKMKSVDSEAFIQRFTPRRSNSPWALRNKVIAERLISEGRMTGPGLECIKAAKSNGWWDSAYTSKTPPKVPVYIEAELKKQNAWEKFNTLSNSARLQYVYWIEEAKRPETKMRRIVETIERISK
jgi:uncharacterized protein YdeI (YjbR/CyaY-like superfamily)